MIGLAIASHSGSAVITVSGRLVSGPEAESLRRCLAVLIPDHREISIDLASLFSLDAAGIGVLVEAHSAAASLGGHMMLLTVPLIARALLELTGLASVLVDAPALEHARRVAGST